MIISCLVDGFPGFPGAGPLLTIHLMILAQEPACQMKAVAKALNFAFRNLPLALDSDVHYSLSAMAYSAFRNLSAAVMMNAVDRAKAVPPWPADGFL